MLRAAIACAAMVATVRPPTAEACLNGTIMEGDDAVKAIVRIEAALDAGAYATVRSELSGELHWMDERLAVRATDAEMVLALRTAPRQVAKRAAEYFGARSKSQPKNMRFRALLAEAYATLNKREQALAILKDLHDRDLMPDGFAYVTLAKLSSNEEVEGWLEVCRKRSKTKSICQIPTAARKPAPKPVRTFNMKLPS